MTPTQVLTLGMLAVAWLAIAFPLAMRTRSESVSGSVTGFTQAMSVLDPELKASTVSAATSSTTRTGGASSHLQVLRRLLGMAVLSTVLCSLAAWQWGGVFIPLAVVSVGGTAGYVGLLRRRKVEQDRARAVITSIRDHAGLPAQPRRQREVLPRVVGQGPELHVDAGSAPDGHRSKFASDVRVVSESQRIQAHHGFDVLH